MPSWGQSPEINRHSPEASLGRDGDDHTAHVQTGETIVPPVISPELRAALFKELAAAGLNPEEFVVGSQGMSINPATGLPEFGWFKKIFKSISSIPIVGPAIAPAVGFAVGGPAGAALASGVQTKALGGSWGQAIGAAAGSYLGGQIGGPGTGTVGSTLASAGLDGVAGSLGTGITNATISSITGSMLGSSIGTGVGGLVDAPKEQKWGNEFANLPVASTPTGGGQGGVAIPGDSNNANNPQGPSAEELSLAAQRGAGITVGTPNVNYQATVLDRETGRPRTINTSFSNNFDRRNSWGNGVSFA